MNKDKKLKDVIEAVEDLITRKQKNRTIRSVNEEALLLSGAMQVIHLIFSKDEKRMDSVPPRWFFGPMSSRSINGHDYREEE